MSMQQVPQQLSSTMISPPPTETQVGGTGKAMEKKQYFRHVLPSANYIFGNGKPAIFVRHIFATSFENEIAELTREIALGNPHIRHVTEEERIEIETTPADIIANMRQLLIAEFMAKGFMTSNPDRDMGTTKQEPVRPANSANIAVAAAGGSGSPVLMDLQGLAKQLAAMRGTPVQALESVQEAVAVGDTKAAIDALRPIFSDKVQGDSEPVSVTALTGLSAN